MSDAAAMHGHGPAGEVTKHDFLKLVTGAAGAVGTAAFVSPTIASMNPPRDVSALSAMEVDLAPIAVGSGITVMWQDKPIFVRQRTEQAIKAARDVPLAQLIDPQVELGASEAEPRPVDRADRHPQASWLRAAGQQANRRARRLGWLVLPLPRQPILPRNSTAPGTSGRVRHDRSPANLSVPDYAFDTDSKIKIG